MAGTVPPDDVILQILPKLPLKSLLRFKSVSKTWYSIISNKLCILEIFAKLPHKSLLRFKSVCKTWCSTISDPQFSSKLHWIRPSVLICQNSETFSTISIESLLTAKNKALTRLSLPWETEDPSGDIDHLPSEAPGYRDRAGNYLIGSCNGLVCVDHRRKSGGGDLILWKPSTGKFRRLPRCSRVRKEIYHEHYVWFGYDSHDYKLVWIDYHRGDPRETKLNVLTLKSNVWRRKDDCGLSRTRVLSKVHDFGNPRIIGVLSHGAIHWRTNSGFQTVILALDLATEKFQVLDFANYPFDPRGGAGGCLVGGCSCVCGAGGKSLQIVKEYGCRERSKYYPILFSSGKEILAVFDLLCCVRTYDDWIIKYKIEEGGEKVSSQEIVLRVANIPEGSLMQDTFQCRNNIVLHMDKCLVSLTYF